MIPPTGMNRYIVLHGNSAIFIEYTQFLFENLKIAICSNSTTPPPPVKGSSRDHYDSKLTYTPKHDPHNNCGILILRCLSDILMQPLFLRCTKVPFLSLSFSPLHGTFVTPRSSIALATKSKTYAFSSISLNQSWVFHEPPVCYILSLEAFMERIL